MKVLILAASLLLAGEAEAQERFQPSLTQAEQQQLLPDRLVSDGAANVGAISMLNAQNAARAFELSQQLIEARRQISKLEAELKARPSAEVKE